MSLKNLPQLSFATADIATLETSTIKLAEKILGRKIAPADPVRLLIQVFLSVICQQRLLIDETAKQNLLAYASGDALDHLAALVGVERLPASKATTTVQVTLSAAREQATAIRRGTRITGDDQIFFALDEDLIFAAGETSKTASATATATGEAANGFAPGELDRIVDPQPFLLSITNLTTSEGGSDIETDDNLRERAHIAPEAFTCAGSEGAYIARAKEASSLIVDVYVTSPAPGEVEVFPLLEGGSLPDSEMLAKVSAALNKKTVRPLTDIVTVSPPTQVSYSIDLSWFISSDDSTNAAQIASDVQAAVADYIEWQRSKLGRDINPDELLFRLKAAGIKRAVIRAPLFQVVDEAAVAICQSSRAVFDGLEDD